MGIGVRCQLIVTLLLATSTCWATDHTFLAVVDSATTVPPGNNGSWFFEYASLDAGHVAFRAFVGGAEGIFAYDGQVFRVADLNTAVPQGTGNFTSLGGFQPAVSASAAVFRGLGGSSQSGIYAGNPLVKVADRSNIVPGTGQTFTSLRDPSADGNQIVFIGSGPSRSGIFTSSGASIGALVDTTMSGPGGASFTAFADVAVANGNIGFSANEGSEFGIYKRIGSSISTVANQSTAVPSGGGETFFDFPMGYVDFDGQSIAFMGASSTHQGVYTDQGGRLRRVADNHTPIPGGGGNFDQFFIGAGPSVDQEVIAFHGRGPSADGIFVDVGGVLSRLVVVGDTINGKTVSSLTIGSDAVSDGQVLLIARFSDQTQGIYLASVPEPSLGIALIVVAIAVCRPIRDTDQKGVRFTSCGMRRAVARPRDFSNGLLSPTKDLPISMRR